VQNPNASTSTLTLPTPSVTVTANYYTQTVACYPVTGHRRLWTTQNDLPCPQSWATASSPIYEQGILPALNNAISIYNTQFFPRGVPDPNYPDPGDT
jgi:hypothetical protein